MVAVFIATISAGSILENVVLLAFGPEPRSTPPILGNRMLDLGGGLVISEQSIAVICAAFILIAGQYALFAHTRFGRRMRAVAQDPDMAAASGINVKLMIAFTFVLLPPHWREPPVCSSRPPTTPRPRMAGTT